MAAAAKKVKEVKTAKVQKAKTLYLVKAKSHYDGSSYGLYGAQPKVTEQQLFKRTGDGDWEPNGTPTTRTEGHVIHSFCSSFGKSTGLSLGDNKIYKVTMSVEDVTPVKVPAPPVKAKK